MLGMNILLCTFTCQYRAARKGRLLYCRKGLKSLKNYEKAYKDRQKGMTYKDIAAKYNVSINTVKSWKIKQWARIEEDIAHKEQEKAHKDTHIISPEEAAERIKERKANFNKAGVKSAKNDSEHVKEVRQLVEVKRASAPPAFSFKDTGKMIQRISDYFLLCDQNKRPYTKAGLILALNISKSTFSRYLSGEMDYMLEEHIAINSIDLDTCDKVIVDDTGEEIAIDVDGNPLISFSHVLQKALLRLEDQAESRLYWKGRPGDIFTMKQYGWTDEKSPNTVNNTLVIASAEESDRALKLLYGGK